MMDDLISRISLKQSIVISIILGGKKTLDQIIDEEPSIDAVKHGRWIAMSDADGVYWACSECGEDIPRISHYNPQFDLFPRLESIDKTNYCPNCGAYMKGKKNETD